MDKDKLKEQFKSHAKDAEELRRKRLEEMVELRKATKDDQMSKRRGIDEDEDGYSSNDSDIVLEPHQQQERIARIMIINQLMSGPDPAQHLSGLKMAHEFLQNVRPSPIEVFVTHGVIPKLVEYLKCEGSPEIQYEACWVLTTLAFGNHVQTGAVVQAGVVDVLFSVFDSPDPRISDQAVWCMGNISGDGPEMRQMLRSKGLVTKLIEMAHRKQPAENLSSIVWTLANMCENPENPNEELLACLKIFTNRLYHNDLKVVRESARGISMLSENDEWLNEIYESNMLQQVTYLLESGDCRMVKPCLKIISNFAAGSDTQAQYVLDAVSLPVLLQLAKSPRKQFMKEATRAIGNIACGTFEQILTVLNGGLAPVMVYVLEKGDKDSQVEALYVLANTTAMCKMDQLIYLQKHGIISAVCSHLKSRNSTAVFSALKCVHNMLRIAARYDELEDYIEFIEEAKGLEYMEALETNENDNISSKASYVVEKYFNDNEDGQSSSEVDETVDGSGDREMTFCVPTVPTNFEFNFH